MKNMNSNKPGRVFADAGHLASEWDAFLTSPLIVDARDASSSMANTSLVEVDPREPGTAGWNTSSDLLYNYSLGGAGVSWANASSSGNKSNYEFDYSWSNTTGGSGNESEYEYDYDAALWTFDWSHLAPALAVYAATYVVGVVGNGLIIFTICRFRRLKTTTNVFLASLASADLLLILLCIPVKVSHYTHMLSPVFCHHRQKHTEAKMDNLVYNSYNEASLPPHFTSFQLIVRLRF